MKADSEEARLTAARIAARDVIERFWSQEPEQYRWLRERQKNGQVFNALELLAAWMEWQELKRRQRWARIVALLLLLLATAIMFLPELLSWLKIV